MNEHKIRLTDLLPLGYERYKERNNLRTAQLYCSGGWPEPRIQRRAEFLNDWEPLANFVAIAGTLTAGGLAICGAFKVYNTLEQVIGKVF